MCMNMNVHYIVYAYVACSLSLIFIEYMVADI